MEKPVKKKVVIYAIQNNNLLVFRHVDYSYEEIGLQVPSGTAGEGEELATAALRELTEETGSSQTFSKWTILYLYCSLYLDCHPRRIK